MSNKVKREYNQSNREERNNQVGRKIRKAARETIRICKDMVLMQLKRELLNWRRK